MPVWFNRFFADFQRKAIERIYQQVTLPKNSRGLDLGCGTGRWCEWLTLRGLRTTGFDLGLRAVSLASQRLKDTAFACACLPNIPLASGSFDLITSIMVLQHLKPVDQLTALNEIRRVLKPQGYFLACEMVDTQDQAAHIFSHSNGQWRGMLAEAGFVIIAVTASEYLPFVKTYHALAKLRGKENEGGVEQIGGWVNRSAAVRALFRAVILVAYPMEWLAAVLFPPQWARLNVFLARRK